MSELSVRGRPEMLSYPTKIWGNPYLSQSAKLILINLWSYANRDGTSCFPAIATIAKDCQVDRRTVQRTIKRLIELGWLETEERPGTSSIYVLLGGDIVPGGVRHGAAPWCDTVPPDGKPSDGSQEDTHSRGVRVPWGKVQSQWNNAAPKAWLPQILIFDDARKKAFRARLREHGTDFWDRVLAEIPQLNDYARGSDGWRVDFDYVISLKGSRKLLEGGWRHEQTKPRELYQTQVEKDRAAERERERVFGTSEEKPEDVW